MYIVYAIGRKEDLVEPYTNCYIGVTNDKNRRWKNHLASKYTVGNFIRDNKLSPSNMITIYEGDEEACYELEQKFRPFPFMGLNESTGGRGGKTTYTQSRNKKISEALSGKKKSEAHINSISDAKKQKGSSKGKKNPNAKKWHLTSPDNNVYYIHGNLNIICESLDVLENVLRKNLGHVVPKVSAKFRPKDIAHMEKRMNTTGWKLSIVADEGGVL